MKKSVRVITEIKTFNGNSFNNNKKKYRASSSSQLRDFISLNLATI
jgi:hypothetical protein